jgi:hypothetical protein
MGKSGGSGIGHILAVVVGVFAMMGRMCSKVDDVARVGLRSADNFADASRYGRNADAFDDYLKHADELRGSRYADDASGMRYGDNIGGGLHGQSMNNQIDNLYDRMIQAESRKISKAQEIEYMKQINPEFNAKIDAIYDDAMYASNPRLAQKQIDELVEEFRTPEVIKYMAKMLKITHKTIKIHKLYGKNRSQDIEGNRELKHRTDYVVFQQKLSIPAGYHEINSIKNINIKKCWMDTNAVITVYAFGWANFTKEDHLKHVKVNNMNSSAKSIYRPGININGDNYTLTMRDKKSYGIFKTVVDKDKFVYLDIESEDENYIANNGEYLLLNILKNNG